MQTIRVGIVGSGMMGLQHAEAVRRIPGTELVALAASSAERAERTCAQLCIPRPYGSFQEMLEQERLDAIHICTPNYTHGEFARLAIERGVHVFCEKPLGMSPAETGALCSLAEASGVVAAVNFNYRFNALIRDMHARLQAEDLGRSFFIRGTYLQDWMLYSTDYNWRCEPALGGPSRAIADIGSHWFDAVEFVTGERIARVYARLITVHPQRIKEAADGKIHASGAPEGAAPVDIHTEDAAFILFETTSGIPGTLTVSQVSAGCKNAMEIAIDGAHASLTWAQENPDKFIIGTRDGGKTIFYGAAGALHGDANAYTSLPAGHAVGWADGLKNSVAAFYDAIRGVDPARHATFRDGHHVTEIVAACLESSRLDRWVQVGTAEAG